MGRVGIASVAACLLACSSDAGGDTLTGTDAQESSGSESSSTTAFSASISETAPVTTTSVDGSEGSSTGGSDCSEIEAESMHCLTIDGSNVHLVGLDSGLVCELARLDTSIQASSLVRDEGWVYGCDDAAHVPLRAELASGEIEVLDVSCQALAQHADGLLVLPSTSGSPELYATFDAIAKGMPVETFMIEPAAARIAVDGDRLYSSWHETAAVQVWELSTSTYLMDVLLEGYDGDIFGLAAIDDRVLILGPPEDKVLRAFESASGALLDEIPLPELVAPMGLACRARA